MQHLVHMNIHFIRNYTALIVLIFAGINFIFYFINSRYDYTFPYIGLVGYTTFAMMFGLLVYESVLRETKLINRLFANPVLKFLGRISYGFYIFHWPVYLVMKAYLLSYMQTNLSAFSAELVLAVAATGVAIIISLISHRYFESYFLRLKEKYASCLEWR